MARVTVEDCLENVKNRFELVLISSKRARQIAQGAEPLVEVENDKCTVVALREIADGLIDAAILDETVVESAEWTSEEEVTAELEAGASDGEVKDDTSTATNADGETGDATTETGEIDVAAALAAALAADLGTLASSDTASETPVSDSPSEEN